MRKVIICLAFILGAAAFKAEAVTALNSGSGFELIKAWWIGPRNEFQLQLEDKESALGMLINFSRDINSSGSEIFLYSLREPQGKEPEVAMSPEELRSILLRAVQARKRVELNIYPSPIKASVDVEPPVVPSHIGPYAGMAYTHRFNSESLRDMVTQETYYVELEARLQAGGLQGTCSTLLQVDAQE